MMLVIDECEITDFQGKFREKNRSEIPVSTKHRDLVALQRDDAYQSKEPGDDDHGGGQ